MSTEDSADPRATVSLRGAAAAGSRAGAMAGIAQQGVGLVATGVLARLLTPHDFGIIAVAAIIVGLFELCSRVGLGVSLVRLETINDRIVSTFFWTMAGLGCVIAFAAWAASPAMAGFAGQPDAAPYIAALSVGLALSITSSIPNYLLRRDFRFYSVYGADVLGVISYALTAVLLVNFTDIGAWAIISGRIVAAGMRFIILMSRSKLRPKLLYDRSALKGEIGFGIGVLGATLTMWISKNADYWMVSRTASTATLGVYYMAYTLPHILRQRVTWVASGILLPLMSSIRQDRDRLTRAYVEMVAQIAFLTWPVLVGLSLVSREIIFVFFGSQWSASVEPASIIAVAAAVQALGFLPAQLFLADGQSGRSFVVTAAPLPVLLPALFIAREIDGLEAIAWAVFGSSLVTGLFGQWMASRNLLVSLHGILRALAPVALPTLAMAGAVSSVRMALPAIGPIASLLVLVVVGVVTYGAVGLVFYRRSFSRLLESSLRIIWPKANLGALTDTRRRARGNS